MSQNAPSVKVTLEFTPDPNALKYVINKNIMSSGTFNITQSADADSYSPLAARLFALSGVAGVLLGKDFVRVSKTDSAAWDVVHKECGEIIAKHLASGGEILSKEGEAEFNRRASGVASDRDKEIQKQILEIIDNEIRPAVNMDGGDIDFVKYENGVVYVELQGACRGCPGARMTLKMGVERRIRQAIPEVQEVVAV
jgi:Fe-S cluster biogenesis protein NfuA